MMMAETHICSNNNVDGDGEQQQQQCLRGMDRYQIMKVINAGSYGVVYGGLDKLTGEMVAIKYEKHGLSKSTLREIYILASLPSHPSIVGLRDVIVDDRRRALVVMECMDSDLQRWIRAARRPLTVSEIKTTMKKILEGVAFLHGMGVMHRDLKPGNILINSFKGDVKICDFGLSRAESKSGLYTARGVGTRWYRAPELLLAPSNSNYTTAVDMWSVGCIMAELLLREVLFPGRSEIHQYCLIHETVGISPYYLHRKVTTAVCVGGMPVLTAAGADLLEGLLAFDPKNRMTATEALNHTWFKEFYGFIAED